MITTPPTRAGVVLFALCLLVTPVWAWAACGDSGVSVQVLGSGGPFGAGRASAGYIVWVDGVSRIMVDAGGGTFARFYESGARVPDLDLLALSHFHPDHASEVPALLWPRGGDLRVAGPSGSERGWRPSWLSCTASQWSHPRPPGFRSTRSGRPGARERSFRL